MENVGFFNNEKLWKKIIFGYLILLVVFIITFYILPLYNVFNFKTLLPQLSLILIIGYILCGLFLFIGAWLVKDLMRMKKKQWFFHKKRSRVFQGFTLIVIVVFSFSIGMFFIQLSNAIHVKTYQVEMRDGIKLNTIVYGNDLDEKRPVMLVRTSYGSTVMPSKGFITDAVENGFHVVIQDCRGCPPKIQYIDVGHYSEGEFYPFRPEIDDGEDTIDWILKQQFSNQEIYMWGVSYLAWTTFAAASTQPDNTNFKGGAVSIFGSSGYDAAYCNGILIQNLPAAWIMAMTEATSLTELTLYDEYDPPLQDLAGNITPDTYNDSLWVNLITQNVPNEFWEMKGDTRLIEDINVPLYSHLGYYDFFAWSGIKDWEYISKSTTLLQNSTMVLTPTGHFGSLKDLYEIEPNAKLAVNKEMTEFIYNLEDGNIPNRQVRAYIIGANDWLVDTQWPISTTTYDTYYLQNNHTLMNSTQLFPANLSYTYDPGNTLNYAQNDEKELEWGTWEDHTIVTEQDDSLVFDLPISGDGLTVCGQLNITLNATTDAIDPDWVVEVLDYDPNADTNRFLCHGMLRAKYRTWDTLGTLTDVIPGESTEYSFESWPIGAYFKPGHSLRLVIRSSKYPYFAKNSNGGNLYEDENWTVANNAIHTGLTNGSRIILPVVPNL